MPHIEPLTIENAPAESQPVLKAIEQKLGKSLNIFCTAAYQPDVLNGLAQINDGIGKDLPGKLREMAYFKSSQINDCDYCLHYHTQAAKQVGISDAQLQAMESFASSDAFDEQEKAVLTYAEQLTKAAKVDAAVVAQLKEFLNEKQLVTLAATVALANFTNRFNHGLDIQLP